MSAFDLRLRATRSRDVREATFSERFDNSPGGGSVIDPNPPPQQTNPQSTITLTNAGNPDLKPEVADTTVVGFVYQPRWAENLRMSLDGWEVDISDSIATLGAQQVVDECYNNNVLCQYVYRDTSGVLSRVLSPYLNLDLARARGLDFEVVYANDVDLFSRHDESLSIRFLGGRLLERTNTVVGSTPAEFAGTRGATGTFPDLTANVTLSYRAGAWSVQVQERFIDEVILNRIWVEGVHVDKNTIPSRAWTNLVLGYVNDTGDAGNWRLTLSVQNAFDKDPPIIPSAGDTRFGAQATDATYDEWGRRYQLGFNMEF